MRKKKKEKRKKKKPALSRAEGEKVQSKKQGVCRALGRMLLIIK